MNGETLFRIDRPTGRLIGYAVLVEADTAGLTLALLAEGPPPLEIVEFLDQLRAYRAQVRESEDAARRASSAERWLAALTSVGAGAGGLVAAALGPVAAVAAMAVGGGAAVLGAAAATKWLVIDRRREARREDSIQQLRDHEARVVAAIYQWYATKRLGKP